MNLQEVEARRRAIDTTRAQILEANRAFGAVINARHNLSEARRLLAVAIAASPNGTPPGRYAQHVADCEAKVVQAEAYAREICAERLQQHDAALAVAEAAADRRRADDEAARLAGECEARERGRLQAEARMRSRANRADEDAAFNRKLGLAG